MPAEIRVGSCSGNSFGTVLVLSPTPQNRTETESATDAAVDNRSTRSLVQVVGNNLKTKHKTQVRKNCQTPRYPHSWQIPSFAKKLRIFRKAREERVMDKG